MIRSDLAQKLAFKMNVSKQEADRYLLAFIDAIMVNLKVDGKVVIQGFGSFRLNEYAARIGKKPVTGEPIPIPARKKPVFRASKELNQIINSDRPGRRRDRVTERTPIIPVQP
ncbi:MAG: HU family DNA-binding protein [Nitrospinaceae bacterium]